MNKIVMVIVPTPFRGGDLDPYESKMHELCQEQRKFHTSAIGSRSQSGETDIGHDDILEGFVAAASIGSA